MPFINPNVTGPVGPSVFQTDVGGFQYHTFGDFQTNDGGFQHLTASLNFHPGGDHFPFDLNVETPQWYDDIHLDASIFTVSNPTPSRHSIAVPTEYQEYLNSELDTRFNTLQQQIGGIVEQHLTQLRGEFSDLKQDFGKKNMHVQIWRIMR